MMKEKIYNFFSGSFFRTAIISVILSLAPAFIIVVCTSVERRNDNVEFCTRQVLHTAQRIAQHQALLAETSRTLLDTLRKLEVVKDKNPAACQAIFRSINGQFEVYENIALVEPDGELVAAARPASAVYQTGRRYRNMAEQGLDFIAGEILDEKLLFASPLRGKDGKVTGMLILTVNFSYYTNRIDEMNIFPPTTEAKRNLNLRRRYGSSAVAEENLPPDMEFYLVNRSMTTAYTYNSRGDWHTVPLPPELTQAVQKAEDNVQRITLLNGQTLLVAAQGMQIPGQDKPYAHVLITVPEKSVYAADDLALKRDIAVLISCALGSLLLSWFLCLYLFKRPSRLIIDHTTSLKDGELYARLDLKKLPGIFRQMGAQLNNMAEKLDKRTEDMRVACLTAENAARTKSEFLANMSHEIRTPMNAVLGLTYLSLKAPLEPNQQNYIRKIQTSGKALLRIVNDILDFSRMEAGKLSMERIRFAPRDLFSGLAERFQEQLEGRRVQLIIEVDPAVPFYLVGDPLRLEQAIAHLIEHSLQYTTRGIVRVACSLISIVQNECSLRIIVADTGQGMHHEQLHALQNSLDHQAASTHGADGGLGLVLSQRLFMIMSGTMNISSEQGRGTVFTCTARFTYYATEQNLHIGLLRGRRVLVIDDDEVVLPLMSNLLTSFSMDASATSDLSEGIKMLLQADSEGHGYDFIMLDWRMAEKDGIDIFRRLGQFALTPNPYSIVMSSYGREELRSLTELAGATAFLHKPINSSMLLDTMMGILERAEGSREEAAAAPANAPSMDDLPGLRVLLVEDNPVNQQLGKELMEDAGIVVTVAGNGSEALHILGLSTVRPPFDIILMDLQMPVMDGYETTWRIRKDTHLGACFVPVIAMTAHSQADEIAACRNAGMDDHVAKPIEVGLLFAAIQRWLPPREEFAEDCRQVLERLLHLLGQSNSQALMFFTQQKNVFASCLGEGRVQKIQRLLQRQAVSEVEQLARYLLESLQN